MLFLGADLSLTHHFYYKSLNGEAAGDNEKQAWATRIGSLLAILVTFCLRAGIAVVIGQYIWMAVSYRAFTWVCPSWLGLDAHIKTCQHTIYLHCSVVVEILHAEVSLQDHIYEDNRLR